MDGGWIRLKSSCDRLIGLGLVTTLSRPETHEDTIMGPMPCSIHTPTILSEFKLKRRGSIYAIVSCL